MWLKRFPHFQVAQISNGTGSGSPYLDKIINTGSSYIRGIGVDQDSNVWVTHQDGTINIIMDADGSTSPVQGISLVSGLANAYSFSGKNFSFTTFRSSRNSPTEYPFKTCFKWSHLAVFKSKFMSAAAGDSTGYMTAQVTGSATTTYLHDTAVKGVHLCMTTKRNSAMDFSQSVQHVWMQL